MRKHRGLTKDGKWVYGWYFCMGDCHYIMTLPKDEGGGEISQLQLEVLSETVGQSTGLKDKNGREIYEGTLLKDPQGNVGKVFYGTSSASYVVNWHRKDGTWETDSCIEYGEVIGNIHENLDLLETK